MGDSLDTLADAASWDASDTEARLCAARAVAERLEGFEASPTLVGARGMAELVHRATGLPFVLVPGGAFAMGLRDDELDRVLAPAAMARSALDVEQVLRDSRPARSIDVKPFLCSRSPVLDLHVQRIDRRLVGRCPLDDQGDVDDEGELAGYEDGHRALSRPAFLTAVEAVRVSRALGLRCLDTAEWEYVARDLGARARMAGPDGSAREIERAVAALSARPVFLPERRRDDGASALGLWALHLGEWVVEGDEPIPGGSRGGAVLSWPWQDPREVGAAHPAVRRRGGAFGSYSALRLARSVPAR